MSDFVIGVEGQVPDGVREERIGAAFVQIIGVEGQVPDGVKEERTRNALAQIAADAQSQIMDNTRRKRIGDALAQIIVDLMKHDITECLVEFSLYDDDFLTECIAEIHGGVHSVIVDMSDHTFLMLEVALSVPELRAKLITEISSILESTAAPLMQEFKHKAKKITTRGGWF